MKTTLMIDDEIFEEFQCAVEDDYGKLKGAQSEAFKEAVLLWLAHKKGYPVFVMSFMRKGKSFVFKEDELESRLREALSMRRLPDILVHPVGICPPGYIAKALRVLLDVYGPPKSAEIEIFGIRKPLTETDPEKIERMFWEAEDGSGGDVELMFVWKEQRVIATFFPDTFIIRKANFMSFERGAGARNRSPTKVPELGAVAHPP
jgi:hypothetical protein